MSWLGQENDEWLRPFVEGFIKAHEQEMLGRERKQEAEDALLNKMIDLELDEICYGEWRITVHLPDEGDVSLIIVRRDVVDLT